jgi:glycosyltransferase involved in cell wall biosynthesis
MHLITELDIGGAQKALARLLAHLDKQRFAPVVACLYNGDKIVAHEIRAQGISVTDLGMTAKWRWDALWRLYRLLRRERPTILHTWLFHANLPGRILGRLAGVPIIICSERTMAMESAWRYRANRWTIGLVDRVTAVSASVRDFCVSHIGLPADKLVVIPNGVELPEGPPASSEATRIELGLPPDGLVIGAVTRLDPVKGVDFLIRALVQVDEVILVIVGDGTERAALKVLADDLGVASRIHWAGHRCDVPNLLPAFDLFVQPSLHEGMPNTVLEAMAAGLPVVATAVGGTPDVVVDGVTGFLTAPYDPGGLAEAITNLLHKPDLRRRMGQAGKEHVEQYFGIKETVRQVETLYETLLHRKGY